MKILNTHAIVLDRINYGEADRIMTCLLEAGGKQALIAKGSRRLKSKLAGGIEPLAINEFAYATGRGQLGVITSARMASNFADIKADYARTHAAYIMIAWLKNYLEDGSGEEYYPVLSGSLSLLDSKTRNPDIAYIYFFTRVFGMSGQGLELRLDSQGSALAAGEQYKFSLDQMAFEPEPSGSFNQEHIKVLRLASSVSPQDMGRVAVPTDIAQQIKSLLEGIQHSF